MANKISYLISFFCISFFGFFLQELPSSNAIQSIFPEWPLIFTLFFVVSKRTLIGVIPAFIIGLIQDVFLSMYLGFNAGIYTLLSFILLTYQHRFGALSIFNQSIVIGILVTFKLLFVYLYNFILFSSPTHYWWLLNIAATIVVWPILHLVLSFVISIIGSKE